MRSNTRARTSARRLSSLATSGALVLALTPIGFASAVDRTDAPDIDAICADADPGFPDLPASGSHVDAIRCLRALGVVQGFADGTYRARERVTRDQMATFIANAVVQVRPLPAVPPTFGDVAGSPHAANIGRLEAAGIVRGRDTSTYAPRATVTRDQLASFVVRALAYAVTGDADAVGQLPVAPRTFPDVPSSHVHADAIATLAGAGIVSGYVDGTFRPRDDVRRDQMATFLVGGLRFAVELLPEPEPELPAVRLVADVDRDGELTDADLPGRDAWTENRGAIMLANIDDDADRCEMVDEDGRSLTDDELPLCHDAADEIINGEDDLADLAPFLLDPIADLSADASATLTFQPEAFANVFVAEGDDWTFVPSGTEFDATALAAGLDLRIEATDIVRDVEVWDGFVDVHVEVTDGDEAVGDDHVVFRVAPLLFVNNTMPLQQLIVAEHPAPPAAPRFGPNAVVPELDILGDSMGTTMAAGPSAAPSAAAPGVASVAPLQDAPAHWPNGYADFRADLRVALDELGHTEELIELNTGSDRWVQDMFEPAYMSMPAPGGGEHRIRVYIRTANQSRSQFQEGRPLREGGRALFDQLRGPGVAVVQQYDPSLLPEGTTRWPHDTFNSGGNFEAAPPFVHPDGREFPAGRMIYGARPPFAADGTFRTMLEAQGYQDPIQLDTSWLRVGHVDEFTTFLPADNERGWILGVADARLGTRLLEEMVADGLGDERLVNDVEELGGRVALGDLTVNQARFHPELRLGQTQATLGIDEALEVLIDELGLTTDEIVRLPALFRDPGTTTGGGTRTGLYAYLPGVANGISTGTGGFLAPKQHGPQRDGVDVFQQATEEALAEHDIEVGWVEDWVYAHQGTGEIHCVTNAKRDLTVSSPWWGQSVARTQED